MTFSRFVSLLFVLGVVLVACSEDTPTQPEPQPPVIENIIAPKKAYLGDPAGAEIRAQVNDPDGLQDIDTVSCQLQLPGGTQTTIPMLDDGRDGDILAKDGQYFARVAGSTWGAAGSAGIMVQATDKGGLAAESDTVALEIIDGSPGSAPKLSDLVFPGIVYADSLYGVQLLVRVNDDGLSDIDSVIYAFFPPASPVPGRSGQLHDDGQNDDGVSGNGIFGARWSSTAFGNGIGIYSVRLQAFDRAGNRSLPLVQTFQVISRVENLPPRIVSVSAPDTVSRAAELVFTIRAVAEDPNGLTDLQRVFFNSFLPDGKPASGNPFFMRDDGVIDNDGNGDRVANDGEYALVISISRSNATGVYRFEFQAEDRSGLVSETVVHTITVVE